jgi:ATPase family associated with various cellular activities (AAA)
MNTHEREAIQLLRSTEPAFMARIRLRAQRRILWLRELWMSNMVDGIQGLAISHSEVDRILADPEQHMSAEATFYAKDSNARHLSDHIHSLDQAVVNECSWIKLHRDFALSPEEIDLLTLVVAVEVDPLLRRVYGYLQDDATAGSPTPWLAASLFQWPSRIFGPDVPLVRWHMAWPLEGLPSPWSVNAPWMADPHIVAWLIHGQALDSGLGVAVQFMSIYHNDGKMCLYQLQLTELQNFVQAMQQNQSFSASRQPLPIEIELIGPEGVGKRTLAGQFCAQRECGMLVADARLLLGSDVSLAVQVERATRVARTARLINAVLYWHHPEGVDTRVWQMIHGYSDLSIFGTTSPIAQPKHNDVVRKTFRLPLLTHALRIDLWKHLSDEPLPLEIAGWVLTAAEIVNAARVAPAGDEAVIEACRQVLYQGPRELFTPLPCPFTWDDIILSPEVRQHLAELEDQARLRWGVYEEWGFERLFALGRGTTALFAGPSGTGKTMAAQVLARSLSMDLYRVDLASVMSKYIGETEKQLKLIFDTCERANVMLFFDEADALFGQRTQVKDAHDRFANIEIDYLLQRMEQFDGMAILATNRKGDMDSAFLRRLRFIIDFMQPAPAERLALWHLALPRQAPGGEALLDDINWELLASRLTMTGADIKAAGLGAAFLARAEGTRINMKHVLYAARREMAKQGIVLRSGDWEL